ncbi:MAG: hypothetical protein ACQETD_00570 [Pseudomonadota bacterium]
MIRGLYRHFISVGTLLLTTGTVCAGWFGADFSADIHQRNAQQQGVLGKMYVSQGRVRTEMEGPQGRYVEIIDPAAGKAWLLDTQRRRYRERPVPRGGATGAHNEGDPCAALPEARCTPLDKESVNGRIAQKWRIERAGETRLQWMDREHRFAVKVEVGGEPRMVMRYLGEERLGERPVERWQSWVDSPRGALTTTQWYDPQLNIAIRQQSSDGRLRELRNIQVGEQDPALFVLPEGYSRAQPDSGEDAYKPSERE